MYCTKKEISQYLSEILVDLCITNGAQSLEMVLFIKIWEKSSKHPRDMLSIILFSIILFIIILFIIILFSIILFIIILCCRVKLI